MPLSICNRQKECRFYGAIIVSEGRVVGDSSPKTNIAKSIETIDNRRVC